MAHHTTGDLTFAVQLNPVFPCPDGAVGLRSCMGMRQSALHTEILEKLVREPGIHAHGVSGGGQVIDDAVPALLKTADEVIQRWARAEYLAYRCVERQCH